MFDTVHHCWGRINFIQPRMKPLTFAELWVDRSLEQNTTQLQTSSGQKFSGGQVKLNNTSFLITLQVGVTLKVDPLKGSLTMQLILDNDYKGNVTGEIATCITRFSFKHLLSSLVLIH